MSATSDIWITESETTVQTAAAAVALVAGLILVIGFRGFDGSGFTQSLAGFVLGGALLVAGAAALLLVRRQVITVDPRQRRIAVQQISRVHTTTRVIRLDDVAGFALGEQGDRKGGSVRYHVKARLRTGEEVALFLGFFDGARSRLAMEKRRERLLHCLPSRG
jgi:hypothetical protein